MRSRSPEETIAAGMMLANLLQPGDVVLFHADLGAGKTTFTKGVAEGLGIPDTVTSPTYTIISEYSGRVPLYHIDLYRIEGEEEFDNLGLRDILDGNGVSLVEWSEKLPLPLPVNPIVVDIKIVDCDVREIRISGVEE